MLLNYEYRMIKVTQINGQEIYHIQGRSNFLRLWWGTWHTTFKDFAEDSVPNRVFSDHSCLETQVKLAELRRFVNKKTIVEVLSY